MITLIKIYQNIVSPIFGRMFGGACRFTPSCSEYAIEAIQKYGVMKGSLMGVKRIFRCHPLAKSGYDPVI